MKINDFAIVPHLRLSASLAVISPKITHSVGTKRSQSRLFKTACLNSGSSYAQR